LTKPKSASAGGKSSKLSARSLDSAKLIPVSLLDPNPHQPRRKVTTDDVVELASSIKANGVIEPLVVCPKDERYQLIAGYRRLIASKQAGLKEVPCIVREGSETELLELALLENIQRTDLTYIEEAESYKRLMDVAGIDQKAVAERMKKSQSTVSERLALLSLPKDTQTLVGQGRLSIKAALEIGKIANDKRRARFVARADRMTLDELKKTVQQAIEKQKKGRKRYEKRKAHPLFNELFAGLPVKRVYKDQVTFVFKEEEEFINALRKIIERYDSENREQ